MAHTTTHSIAPDRDSFSENPCKRFDKTGVAFAVMSYNPPAAPPEDKATRGVQGKTGRAAKPLLTFDNGREFAGHLNVAAALDCRTYFAKPYHSRECGTNKNANGLLRQYFPKGMDLRGVGAEQLELAMNRLNHRPQKAPGFKTPAAVFSGEAWPLGGGGAGGLAIESASVKKNKPSSHPSAFHVTTVKSTSQTPLPRSQSDVSDGVRKALAKRRAIVHDKGRTMRIPRIRNRNEPIPTLEETRP